MWEVDSLASRKCGCEMKIIGFISEAEVIRNILEQLGLWTDKTPDECAPLITIHERQYEPFDNGWLQHDESFVTVH